MMRSRNVLLLLTAMIIAFAPGIVHAKTIVLDVSNWDAAALIDRDFPLVSWVAFDWFKVTPKRNLLIRYSLDQIPEGMRVTNAELVFPMWHSDEARFYLWRILQEWGPGVSYKYRMVRPQKAEWAEPGARAMGVDHLVRPTAICRPKSSDVSQHGTERGIAVNVTKDVALWHSGAAPNNGWMITSEGTIHFHSPFSRQMGIWKLRITFEPE